MKRRAIVSLAILSLLLGLSACGAKGGAPESGAESSKVEQGSAEDREESKAEKAEEVGLTVNEIPLDENQIQAVSTGQVDIASNTGTWAPLKNIIAGAEDPEFYENAQKFYQEHNTNS